MIDRPIGLFGIEESVLVIVGIMALSHFIQALSSILKDHLIGGALVSRSPTVKSSTYDRMVRKAPWIFVVKTTLVN